MISGGDLEKGFIHWLCEGTEPFDCDEYYDKYFEFENMVQIIKDSLIAILLRTGEKIKYQMYLKSEITNSKDIIRNSLQKPKYYYSFDLFQSN